MQTGRKKIMVVDDSPHIRGLVTLILKSEGYEVIAAENGSEALMKINGSGSDLIITDLKMPEMDGFQLIRRLSAYDAYRNIPVLVMTGEYIPEGHRLPGVCEVVMKPFIPRMLLRSVERFLFFKKEDSQKMEVFYSSGKTG